MDKSWMMKPRSTKEYRDGCRSFVDFAVRNCRTLDRLIVCPCKMCWLNRRHPPGIVLDHLIGGKGKWLQYKEWLYHGERHVYAPVGGSNSNPSAADAGASTDKVGNMQTMLCDLFGMHGVREDNSEPQPEVQGHEEHQLNDEADVGVTTGKSTRTCLKRQTVHFTIRPKIVNLVPL